MFGRALAVSEHVLINRMAGTRNACQAEAILLKK
jgi:hypothetical protein